MMVFESTGLYKVVIEGAQLPIDSTEQEESAFTEIKSTAMILFISLISQSIYSQYSRIRDPHQLWKHLKTSLYSDTAFSFVHQINSLFSLESQFTTSKLLIEFSNRFEAEWALLTQLSLSGTTPYRIKMKEFLECDEPKHDILLSILIPHMANVVDNITTKDSMLYEEAKQRIMSVSTPHKSTSDSALITTADKKSKRIKRKRTTGNNAAQSTGSTGSTTSSSNKTCNGCKKHRHPHEGHMWYECHKLKEEQKKRHEKQAESAHITTESQPETALATTDVSIIPHKSDWIFDTAASSHMTSDIDKFETLRTHHGTVRVGGNSFLDYEGKGTCLVHPILPNGSISTVRLCNVLFVPLLGHNLISWNVLRSRFSCEIEDNDVFVRNRGSDRVVLYGRFIGNLP